MRQREVFLENLYQKMKNNKNIFLLSADFGSPVMDKIKKELKDRFINVGVAEQNLINISTGLALEGFDVFAYAIAPFITLRALEQIRVNLAILSQIRKSNVNLIGVGAGVSYEVSGPTHHLLEDIGIINSLSNVEILSPSDTYLTESFVDRCIKNKYPKYVRLDARIDYQLDEQFDEDLGFRLLKKVENNIFILTTGYFSKYALQFNANVVDIYLLNRFNIEKLKDLVKNSSLIITLEEHFLPTGLAAIINNIFAGSLKKIINIGFNKNYVFETGSREEIHKKYGINSKHIEELIDENS